MPEQQGNSNMILDHYIMTLITRMYPIPIHVIHISMNMQLKGRSMRALSALPTFSDEAYYQFGQKLKQHVS